MLGRRIVILTAMAGLGLPWATAQAGGPHVVVGVGLGVPFYPRPYWGYPYGYGIYVAPRPVYVVPPAPVYVVPGQPVYVQQAPVAYPPAQAPAAYPPAQAPQSAYTPPTPPPPPTPANGPIPLPPPTPIPAGPAGQ
jgi:hypothetical protein